MDATYDILYILSSIVGIVLQIIGICALCVCMTLKKGENRWER